MPNAGSRMETKNCPRCGRELPTSAFCKNRLTSSGLDCYCKECKSIYNKKYYQRPEVKIRKREYHRHWNHSHGFTKSMKENKACTLFLGVHVAERVLAATFENVEKMRNGNPKFDFICGKGYKIDVKSACRNTHPNNPKWADSWTFVLNHNDVTDYFLCIAFDNRDDLTPEHVWLIPADEFRERKTISINERKIDKWSQWERPLDRVVACCNAMKDVQGTSTI